MFAKNKLLPRIVIINGAVSPPILATANITPVTIQKAIRDMIDQNAPEEAKTLQVAEPPTSYKTEPEEQDNETLIAELKVKMQKAAIEMKFEDAAIFRDQIIALEAKQT